MKPSERKALLLLINGIEGQLAAVKAYLGPAYATHRSLSTAHQSTKNDPTVPYTDQDEDDKIAEALERDKATDGEEFLSSLLAKSQEGLDGTEQ